LGFHSLGRLFAQRAPRPKAMSEDHGTQEPCLNKTATCVTATARLGLFAAGPERADEGGGPTPGRLERNNVLRNDS